MTELDKQNLEIPEEVAPYAKEIFDNISKNDNYLPEDGYMKK